MQDIIFALSQDYMQRALIASIIVGISCPIVGLYLVLRRLSLIGDGLGHAAFAGVAAAWLAGINPLLGAAIFAIAGALGVERLRSWRREHGDLALAIVFYSGIALGVVLTSLARRMNLSLFTYLFGSILTITNTDLLIIGITGACVIVLVIMLYKELFTLTYDEDIAKVSGLPVNLLNYLIVLLGAITVVSALRVVGVLLVAGMLVIPVASALQIARSFKQASIYSICFGLASTILGLAFSYILDLAPGGAIVLTAVILFTISSILPSRNIKASRIFLSTK